MYRELVYKVFIDYNLSQQYVNEIEDWFDYWNALALP